MGLLTHHGVDGLGQPVALEAHHVQEAHARIRHRRPQAAREIAHLLSSERPRRSAMDG
jgi:hypothetical protein